MGSYPELLNTTPITFVCDESSLATYCRHTLIPVALIRAHLVNIFELISSVTFSLVPSSTCSYFHLIGHTYSPEHEKCDFDILIGHSIPAVK